MAVALIYFTALAVSIAFFLWCAGSFIVSTRKGQQAKESPPLALDVESEPAVFALYCQYLVAPATALREAQLALGGVVPAGVDPEDFFALLNLLQRRSPSTPR